MKINKKRPGLAHFLKNVSLLFNILRHSTKTVKYLPQTGVPNTRDTSGSRKCCTASCSSKETIYLINFSHRQLLFI